MNSCDRIELWSRNADRAVIFDFNGTLSDDEPILLQIFGDLFAAHFGWELTSDDYETRLRGRSDREIIEAVMTELGRGDFSQPSDRLLRDQLLHERAERYAELVARQSPITVDAVALVALLGEQSVPMAIVTGAQRRDVQAALGFSRVSAFIDVIVAEEDVVHGKPDPEGFLRGAALLGRHPADVLVFEDSIHGLQAARAAGMTTVAVSAQPPGSFNGLADRVAPRLDPTVLTPSAQPQSWRHDRQTSEP